MAWFRLKVGAVFCCLGVVTAADRAAATLRRGGANPSARFAGTSPFRGGFAGSAAKRLPPQRELSAVRLTEDKPFCWGLHCRGGWVYLPPSAAADGPPPSAEGGKWWRQSRHKLVFRLCGGEAVAFRSPPPPLRAHTYKLVSDETLAGRGGSVSRRDHNRVYRRRVHTAWAHKSERKVKPISSRSSGEGVWGGGASLREAASSPEFPTRNLFRREREGGAFSSEKASPSQSHPRPPP